MKETKGFFKSIYMQILAKWPLITDMVVLYILIACPTLFPILRRISSSKSFTRISNNQIQAKIDVISFVEGRKLGFQRVTVN